MQATPASVATVKCELAVEVLRQFGVLRLRVTGSSMLPAIRPGDILWFRRCRPEAAARGDVVLFVRHGRLFAHRVVARSGDCLVTQGDGLAGPDEPVRPADVVGRACRILRRNRFFRPATRPSFADRLCAALVRRSTRAGRLLTLLYALPARAGH